ncbi:MAG: class I SAM-dependent methyltransferase [Thermoflexales bacterium]|nr:class I SAM-dependent methyltransferase [Thermoflexales bacterium]MCX7939004.1 class I SAM-dependent methyltransferase [Thermoflexales bacterium]MDW8292478.1 class I SAM-dependent methyltransferase [Anaerolineae bacterium]
MAALVSSVSFDRAAAFYDQTRALPPHIADQVAQLALRAMPPNARVLEIGVGTGRIARPLLERGTQVVGVDLSRAMMARLRATHPLAPLVQGDAMYLPFADNTFDAVIAVHVLHLVGDWRLALREARRVMRAPGVLLFGHNVNLNAPSRQLRAAFNRARGQASDRWLEVEETLAPTLRAEGAHMTTFETDSWITHTTPRAELEALRQRLWSSTWALSDAELTCIVGELEAWAVQQFGSLDAPLEDVHRFRWWCFAFV